jgi:hypothetical protein
LGSRSSTRSTFKCKSNRSQSLFLFSLSRPQAITDRFSMLLAHLVVL